MRPADGLRCRDPATATASLAALFRADSASLTSALRDVATPLAVADRHVPSGDILSAIATALGRKPVTPSAIHFFHGTRAFDPESFVHRGLLPLSAIRDEMWGKMRDLAYDVSAEDFADLRRRLDAGNLKALTYHDRLCTGAADDGPHGLLVRDMLVKANDYGTSTEFLCVPEIIGDICVAAGEELKVDLRTRFLRATASCIVEFAVDPIDVDEALEAACWYAEAALRDSTAGNRACHIFGHEGLAVPPERIVSVEVLDKIDC